MKQLRLFVAVKIHPGEQFLEHFRDLKHVLRGEKIKWVEEDNVHITVKFIGETPEDRVGPIVEALHKSRTGLRPFELAIEQLGIFGSSYKPRVIWYGIRKEEMMTRLATNIFAELQLIGYEPDRQNFVPHLTIGRIRHIQDKQYFKQVIDNNKPGLLHTERVEESVLYESTLTREGPVYRVVERFVL